MLGIGCNFHIFDINSFGQKDIQKRESDYIPNLLFGDVFYSRAVKYLLRFEDSLVFEEVINALKQMHKSRLLLHNNLLEAIGRPGLFSNIVERETGVLLGANSLFKSSFLLGWSIFEGRQNQQPASGIGSFYKLFNLITLIKSLQELIGFMSLACSRMETGMDLSGAEREKESAQNRLLDIIFHLKTERLKLRLSALLDAVLGIKC